MPEAKAAAKCTCARCDMAVSWMEGSEHAAIPAGWAAEDGLLHCLLCRREMAGEAAILGLPEDAPAEERHKTRSAARIEFEIGRDPSRPDNRIAKSCHTSMITVRKARARMGLPDRPPSISDRGS